MITIDRVETFRADGYLRFGPAMDPDEVEALRAGLDRLTARELEDPDDSSPEFRYGHRRKGEEPQPRAITQFVNVWKRDPAYRRAIRKPLLVGTARALLGCSAVRIWHDQVISKPPGDNDHFQFHQDFYFWPLSHPDLVSCWLALDDATVENGCMHVMPGSHRDPRFLPEARPAELADLAAGRETERQRMARRPASDGKPIELRAGEAMFHHCLNWHATPRNTTERPRRAFVIIFMADGVRFNPEQSPNHVLIPRIEVAPGEPMHGADFPVLG